MPNYRLTVNGRQQTVDVPADMPLLWVLRDTLNLKGTKFGCGIGACGACTVHINGEARRSCTTQVSTVNQPITTIEGLSADGSHPLQKAWMELDVPQCGYCQAGQLMSAAALLRSDPTAHRCTDQYRNDRQRLPLRNLSQNTRSDSPGRQRREKGIRGRYEKNNQYKATRSSFLPAGNRSRRRRPDDWHVCSQRSRSRAKRRWRCGSGSEQLHHDQSEQHLHDRCQEPRNGAGHSQRAAPDYRG